MDIFYFPFQVEIWGTVSDWILTIVTAITLILFYKTFKSQILVQNNQIELLKIEIDRFLKDNKPYFILKEFDFIDFVKEKDKPNLVFHLKQYGEIDLINLKIVSDHNYEFELLSEFTDKVTGGSEISIMFFIKKELNTDFNFTAFLFFEDRYNNIYRQVLTSYKTLENEIEGSISGLSKNDRVTQIFNNIQ